MARADELLPLQGHSVALGSLQGIAYYTSEKQGDRVVATLTDPAIGRPFRVVATLTPGQHLSFSVPRGLGEPAIEVIFVRRGERVFVDQGAASLTN